MQANRTRYFLDTEFIDDGIQIHPISVGIVCEDGREYYEELFDTEIPWEIANEFVLLNVRPNLIGDSAKNTSWALSGSIQQFVEGGAHRPEFWAWYAAYDWVLLCQLFGAMMDLPRAWPQHCMDLKQFSIMLGTQSLPKQKGVEHNALEDARWNFEVFKELRRTWHSMHGYRPLWLKMDPKPGQPEED